MKWHKRTGSYIVNKKVKLIFSYLSYNNISRIGQPILLIYKHISIDVRKRTFWHVRPKWRLKHSLIRVVVVRIKKSSLVIQSALSEDSDQTVQMRRLICIVARRTYPQVHFSDVAGNVCIYINARTHISEVHCLHSCNSKPRLFGKNEKIVSILTEHTTFAMTSEKQRVKSSDRSLRSSVHVSLTVLA